MSEAPTVCLITSNIGSFSGLRCPCLPCLDKNTKRGDNKGDECFAILSLTSGYKGDLLWRGFCEPKGKFPPPICYFSLSNLFITSGFKSICSLNNCNQLHTVSFILMLLLFSFFLSFFLSVMKLGSFIIFCRCAWHGLVARDLLS